MRRGDGRWRRVRADELACPDESLETPRPDERCGLHAPWRRIVRCAAGWRVWSSRRRRWLPLPASFAPRLGYADRSILEDADHVYVITDRGALLETVDEGATWERVELEEPVDYVARGGDRVFASGETAIYLRDVCPTHPARTPPPPSPRR